MRFISRVKFFALVSYLGSEFSLALNENEAAPNSIIKTYRRKNIEYDLTFGTARTVKKSDIVIAGVGSDCASQLSDEGLLNQLGINDPCKGQSFDCLKKVLGSWTTCRCTQMCEGIPVFDSEVTFTYNPAGQIKLATSTYKNGVELEKKVSKSSEEHIESIAAKKYGKGKSSSLKHYSSQLVILHTGKYKSRESKLAWKVQVSKKGEVKDLEVVIDDETGEELLRKDKTFDKRGRQDRSRTNEIKKEPTVFHNSEKHERRDQESFTDTLLSFVTSLLDLLTVVFSLIADALGQTTPSPTTPPPIITPPLNDTVPTTPLSSSPSFTSDIPPSSSPSTSPVQNVNFGFIFDPDPLSTSGSDYCDSGFCDNRDRDSSQLADELISAPLRDLVFRDGKFFLEGPYAVLIDYEAPFKDDYSQAEQNFLFTRKEDGFEAVNCYYHIDTFLRYLNEELELDISPIQYNGGVQFDPHASDGADNSYYSTFDGVLAFGEGGVDDGEDADVIIHELGHGIHDWITGGRLSNQEGLSEGFGDYLAASYSREKQLRTPDEPAYYWVFKWDGHNEYWDGRITNYEETYPDGVTSSIHESGQIWSTCGMKIWDILGREVSDTLQIVAISALGSGSNQQDAAEALYLAAEDSDLSADLLTSIKDTLTGCGYSINVGDVCGDGVLGESEECDGILFRDTDTCEDLTGCLRGRLTCTNKCELDASACRPDASQSKLELILTLDSFPQETSWLIYDFDTDEEMFAGGEDGEYAGQGNEELSGFTCVDASVCFIFEINDDGGDGICCSSGEGDFNIIYDEIEISGTNPEFGSSASVPFGPCNITDDLEGSDDEEDDEDFLQDPGSFSCNPDRSPFRFNLRLDRFPSETSWTLAYSNETTIALGGGYNQNFELVRDDRCLLSDECYELSIKDTAGDGLCCTYGEGDYYIFYDGIEINGTNPEFRTVIRHEFGACDIDTPNNSTNLNGTVVQEITCNETEALFILGILFDNYPQETTWILTNSEDDIIAQGGEGFEYDDLAGNVTFVEECLETSQCYTFELRDAASDGLCCGYGEGDYALWFDGGFINGTDNQFESNIVHEFGACDEESSNETCALQFELILVFDKYPEETSWRVETELGEIVLEGDGYDGLISETINITACLPLDCYEFTLLDAANDGLCCAYGFGSYMLSSDGTQVEEADPEFSGFISHAFGDCDDGNDNDDASCSPGEKLFELVLELDNYPEETSWFLFDNTTNSVVLSGSDYDALNGETITETACLADRCYSFTLLDAAFDGICCFYGEGSYAVSFDGVEEDTDPEFSDKITHIFGSCDGVIDDDESDDSTCVNFALNITLDDYPGETEWTLAASDSSLIASGGPYSAAAEGQVFFSTCIENDQCYTFTLTDAYSDGICCGFGQGSYSITVNGVSVPNVNPAFGSTISHVVGVGSCL